MTSFLKKFGRGFTLIELLIVVAIIAILAAIAVPNFLEAQVRSKVARGKADMRTMVTAIESYAVDNNNLPPMADVGVANPNAAGFHSRFPSYFTTPIAYLTAIPLDPFVGTNSTFSNATYPESVGKRFVFYNVPVLVDDVQNGNDVWGGLENWVGRWLMYGYGPDGTPFQGARATLLPYDPTNGTLSVGNVVRTQNNTDGINPHPTNGDFIWP